MAEKHRVQVRRIYEQLGEDDGTRVLVDRVWPRGLSKDRAALDEWRRDVAPSTELRKWYGHDRGRFEEFRRRYEQELSGDDQRAGLDHLRELASNGTLTLLTATREADISAAQVLAELVRR